MDLAPLSPYLCSGASAAKLPVNTIMTAALTITGVMALILAAPVLLRFYLERLPEAPACPVCRTVTRPAGEHPLADRLFDSLPVTLVRECGQCGWAGRMRWRLAQRWVFSGRR